MPSLHGMPTPTPTLTPTPAPAPAPAPKSMLMPRARIPRSSYASQDAHANAHADPRPCHVAISPFRHAMLSSGPPPSHSFRRYTVSDECEISEEMLGDNCDEQLAVLYREVAPTPHHPTNRHTTTPPSHPYHLTTAPPHRQHYHEDDEARLICGGECFFDVRDKVWTNPTQFFQWAFYLYILKCSYFLRCRRRLFFLLCAPLSPATNQLSTPVHLQADLWIRIHATKGDLLVVSQARGTSGVRTRTRTTATATATTSSLHPRPCSLADPSRYHAPSFVDRLDACHGAAAVVRAQPQGRSHPSVRRARRSQRVCARVWPRVDTRRD